MWSCWSSNPLGQALEKLVNSVLTTPESSPTCKAFQIDRLSNLKMRSAWWFMVCLVECECYESWSKVVVHNRWILLSPCCFFRMQTSSIWRSFRNSCKYVLVLTLLQVIIASVIYAATNGRLIFCLLLPLLHATWRHYRRILSTSAFIIDWYVVVDFIALDKSHASRNVNTILNRFYCWMRTFRNSHMKQSYSMASSKTILDVATCTWCTWWRTPFVE